LFFSYGILGFTLKKIPFACLPGQPRFFLSSRIVQRTKQAPIHTPFIISGYGNAVKPGKYIESIARQADRTPKSFYLSSYPAKKHLTHWKKLRIIQTGGCKRTGTFRIFPANSMTGKRRLYDLRLNTKRSG